ncbi:hypothetical protein ACTFIW_012207 [Dictyostelium discoideum]
MTIWLNNDEMKNMMNNRENIRNIGIIGRVDTGIRTLIDILSISNFINIKRGDVRVDKDFKEDLFNKTNIPLFFEQNNNNNTINNNNNTINNNNNNKFLINVILPRNQIGIQNQISTFHLIDGLLVVVDCIESSLPQEKIIYQSIGERVKPILFLNKFDRFILELKLDSSEIYNSLQRSIERFNSIATCQKDDLLGDVEVSPENGTVGFGSSLYGWAFNLSTFARLYSLKFGISEQSLVKNLWGENYYDLSSKKFSKLSISSDGKPLKHSFIPFILEPIIQLTTAIMDNKKEELNKMLTSLGISLNNEEKKLKNLQLYKVIMVKFTHPISEFLLSSVVKLLPSPVEAQRYRVDNLYDGPLDDECATAIRNCDPNGPLMIYISSMIATKKPNLPYLAFGRIFSGSIQPGKKVRIICNTDYCGKIDNEINNNNSYRDKTIKELFLLEGETLGPTINNCACGNIISILGLENYIVKTGTITDSDLAHNILSFKYSNTSVVSVAIQPIQPLDLPKLIEALKRLVKIDSTAYFTNEETGELLLSGSDENHLESLVGELRNSIEKIKVSQPIVSFKETVTNESSINGFSKSPNKLTRMFSSARPISEQLLYDIENGLISSTSDPLKNEKLLKEHHGWNISEAKKIWTFGSISQLVESNLLVDSTKGVQYISDIKDSVVCAFRWATKQGVLCEEPLRGVRFDINDVLLSGDSIRRGSGQIIPMTRNCLFASQLSASPTLQEPIFMIDINTSNKMHEKVLSILNKRGAKLLSQSKSLNDTFNIKAHIPVLKSFGLSQELYFSTLGYHPISTHFVFDHWKSMGTVCEDKFVTETVLEIRKRKGLNPEIPSLEDYMGKL